MRDDFEDPSDVKGFYEPAYFDGGDMTLQEYCDQLGWPVAELARRAGIDWRTADRAVKGEPISARAARDIAQALSAATGHRVNVGDIVGLNFS